MTGQRIVRSAQCVAVLAPKLINGLDVNAPCVIKSETNNTIGQRIARNAQFVA